jgi:3-oxoacyl-ACP reductase-like protein
MKAGPKPTPQAATLPPLKAKAPARRVLEFFETHLGHTARAKAGQPLRSISRSAPQAAAAPKSGCQPPSRALLAHLLARMLVAELRKAATEQVTPAPSVVTPSGFNRHGAKTR